MLIFIRWAVKVFKKEHAVLERYERSHPHFLRFLALDAILSAALVFAGFQIYESNSSSAEKLTHTGDVVMSSGQLIDHLKKDGLISYWLGQIQGDDYTVNHKVDGIVDLMYLPEGTNASDNKAFIYEIKTYRNQVVWNAHTHPIKATTKTTTIAINGNVSIKINKSSMRGVIATFADKPEIVAIAYPKPQTLNNMIKNVESLKLVR